MSSLPELAELSRALDTLSREEVRYLCMQLGVPPTTLSNIDASPLNDPLTCITKYLAAWLALDGALSWDMVADVLSSARLGKTALATKIRKNYCASACAPPEALPTPVSRQSSESDSVSSTSETESSSASDVDASSLLPTPPRQYDSVDESRPQLKPTPPTADHISTPMKSKLKLNNRQLENKVTRLKRKFRGIVVSANVHLSRQMSRTGFDRFKVELTTIPMLGKTHQFLQRERKRIHKAKSVRKVFEILDPYWNHVDYALLEHIVVSYCDEGLKKQMKRYKRKLHRFEKETSVKNFTTAAVEHHPGPPLGYRLLRATLGMDAEECSLYHVREVKNSISERANLEPYVALLQGLHASAVELTLALPIAVCGHVIQVLDTPFLLENGIAPESVGYSWLDFFRHLHRRQIVKQEEIIYSVRLCDLRDSSRDTGPQLVQKWCERIEHAIHHQKITLQFQWKSKEVEFCIAGLPQGVFTALQLLLQKVLSPACNEGKSKGKEEAHMSMDEESFRSALMPDPPKNVMEELSYVVKHHNLKPRWGMAVKVWESCGRIEAQTRDHHVTIEFQRQRDNGLEFHIVGLEEGVATALQLIQKEFQVEMDESVAQSPPGAGVGPEPTPLTKEALQEHDKQVEKEVRQFGCRGCRLSWWRVVPASKPVSSCSNCYLEYHPIPKRWEYGVGRFTCTNADCGNMFYSECHWTDIQKCTTCSRNVEEPFIHPSHDHKPHTKQHLNGPFSSVLHIPTGSTDTTWLSQTDLLTEDPLPPINPPIQRSLSEVDLRPCLRHQESPNQECFDLLDSMAQRTSSPSPAPFDQTPDLYSFQRPPSPAGPSHLVRSSSVTSMDRRSHRVRSSSVTSMDRRSHRVRSSSVTSMDRRSYRVRSSSVMSLGRRSYGSHGSGHSSAGSLCLER